MNGQRYRQFPIPRLAPNQTHPADPNLGFCFFFLGGAFFFAAAFFFAGKGGIATRDESGFNLAASMMRRAGAPRLKGWQKH